jgi:hypothetical protein
MMLPKINASTKLDEGKSLLLPISHCVRVPIRFGYAVNLMEAVVEESHSENSSPFSLSQTRSTNENCKTKARLATLNTPVVCIE